MLKFIVGLDVAFGNLGVSIFKVKSKGKISWVEFMNIKPPDVLNDEKKLRESEKIAIKIEKISAQLSGVIDRLRELGADDILFCAELPHSGGQDANSVRSMGIATGITCSVLSVKSVPLIVVTPYENKKNMTGDGNADKLSMMKSCLSMLKGTYDTKEIKDSQTGQVKFLKYTWTVKGKKYSSSNFEHMADAFGSVIACIRMKKKIFNDFVYS